MKLKGYLCLVLAVVCLCSISTVCVSAKEATATVASYNSSRGAGELVVFTADYGDTTGTNFWGAEAIVDADNKVTSIVMGNSTIPKDGFVLSGHDDDSKADGALMKTWIHENVAVGDYVYFNRRTMRVTVSDVPLDIEISPFYEVSQTITAKDAPRDENALVVYTVYSGQTTGTNVYGYEVVVDDNGAVVSRGGNDSAIPPKGYVVSGHGTMADWLRSSVISGMRAELDSNTDTVRFIYDADGLKTAMTMAVSQTEEAINTAKSKYVYVDYEAVETALTTLKTTYAQALKAHEGGGDDADFAEVCDAALQELTGIQNSLCDSYPVQYRGVWVRPSQRSAGDVDAYVEELYNAGINTVCVEGWFENGVIMEVPEDCLFERLPKFDYDVLQAYIDACHKRNMECHLWMPIMNIGSSIDSGYERTVVSKRPEWLSLSQEGTPDNPQGFMMIDPANEEAREYLVGFYEYLVTTYDIDCFELDYIRYFASTDELDFGYTEAAFEGFEEQYGYGVTPTYDQSAAYWQDWVQFRCDSVTQMVVAVSEMMDRVAPDMLLSADVNPTVDDAKNRNYQDFMRWLDEGLIDILHPMAYGDGYGEEITGAVKRGGDTCIVVTGLGVQTDSLNAPEMERQAREDNTYGTYGDSYFEAISYLGDKAGDALQATVYRTPALAPFFDRDASIKAALAYMQERLNNVLLPLGGVTQAEAEALTAAIEAATADVAEDRIAPASMAALNDAVVAVANGQARAVLQSDMYRAQRISCVTYDVAVEQLTDASSFAESGGVPGWVYVAAGTVLAVVVSVAAVVVIKKRKKT